ncbi:MAG: DUF1592 domain-containing protein [Akkermansiaceae bacterium]
MKRLILGLLFTLFACSLQAEEFVSIENLKKQGASKSKYISTKQQDLGIKDEQVADLQGFREHIAPILEDSCVQCHGPDKDKGDFRIDVLNPDLVHGPDADWWLEVIEVMANGEMPPPEKEVELSDENRAKVVDWLSGQVQIAAQVKQGEGGYSSFRRLTRYEYGYALQDLLGIDKNVAKALPPETLSNDGFRNSSESLQMSSQQFSIYREIAYDALKAATFSELPPKPHYFAMTMEKGGEQYETWCETRAKDFIERKANGEVVYTLPTVFNRALKAARAEGFKAQQTHFLHLESGKGWNRAIPEGFRLWEASEKKPVVPELQPYALILPPRQSQILNVGNSIPDKGKVRVRVRASRSQAASAQEGGYPSLKLSWGLDPANTHSQVLDYTVRDIAVKAPFGKPEIYEWVISVDGLKRNIFVRTRPLDSMPDASEYFTIQNSYQGEKSEEFNVVIDYIEITTHAEEEWPPASHHHVFPKEPSAEDEKSQARAILTNFMEKAWRRPVKDREVERILKLYDSMRPAFETFEDSMIEVLSTVLTSSHFLYLSKSEKAITDSELASRLSFFLWSSVPDEELLSSVKNGSIHDTSVLRQQAERMLEDSKISRFINNFTHQWLALEILDALQMDKNKFPQFSPALKRSMQREPIALFSYMLDENRSIMDFLHAEYTFLDERLAQHYGIKDVYGNHFRKVELLPESKRGGLLTQPGLLAMNSDGIDSHPLRRSIWLLENLLHDPPPPAPAAVPEIDLTDPEILKMTLKERIEDHRNQPACASCHIKIDPWGIAFEEYDAIGLWREKVAGKPVDATSTLVDGSELSGMEGLKRYLLEYKQDEFVRAMVEKLACYALGRPLAFSDHAEIERITAETRIQGDGLKTIVLLLIESDLFKKS